MSALATAQFDKLWQAVRPATYAEAETQAQRITSIVAHDLHLREDSKELNDLAFHATLALYAITRTFRL